MNEMTISLDTFGAFMEGRVGGNLDYNSIIRKEGSSHSK